MIPSWSDKILSKISLTFFPTLHFSLSRFRALFLEYLYFLLVSSLVYWHRFDYIFPH